MVAVVRMPSECAVRCTSTHSCDEHLSRPSVDAAPNPLTLGVYVDNLALKAANARR